MYAAPEDENSSRAANELTLTAWDPISEQPYYKFAAVQVGKAGERSLKEKTINILGTTMDRTSEVVDKMMTSAHEERVRFPDYLGILHETNEQFAKACEYVSSRNLGEPEIQLGLSKLAKISRDSVELLALFMSKYGEQRAHEPDQFRNALFSTTRVGSYGLLRDLHEQYLLVSEIYISLTVVFQAAQALQDRDLVQTCMRIQEQNELQKTRLLTQVKHRSPHGLVIPF